MNNYKGNYNLVTRNCGDPVISALRAVGIDLVFPPSSFMLGLPSLPPLVPDDLDYALGHTNGLVTGWVAHPKVGN